MNKKLMITCCCVGAMYIGGAFASNPANMDENEVRLQYRLIGRIVNGEEVDESRVIGHGIAYRVWKLRQSLKRSGMAEAEIGEYLKELVESTLGVSFDEPEKNMIAITNYVQKFKNKRDREIDLAYDRRYDAVPEPLGANLRGRLPFESNGNPISEFELQSRKQEEEERMDEARKNMIQEEGDHIAYLQGELDNRLKVERKDVDQARKIRAARLQHEQDN